MGSLNDYNAYTDALSNLRGADFQMSAGTGRSNRLSAAWPVFVPTPATPTTSIAPDRTSDFAIGLLPQVLSGNNVCILGSRINAGGPSGICCILIDLLNISGGLAANTTATQTTNLPTAALTRYTNGEGVMAALIIHQQIGSTSSTFTVSYTNQSGTSGRTSVSAPFGGTAGNRESNSLLPIALQGNDTGIRSVESVTLSVSQPTANNFGVCLFKPLCMFAVNDYNGAGVFDSIASGGFVNALAKAEPNACLTVAFTANTNQAFAGTFLYSEV